MHPHKREERLAPGEIVPVEIEIWPSSTLFRAGEQMRLVVMGKDPHPHPPPAPRSPFTQKRAMQGATSSIRVGHYDSHLLVPIIPQKSNPAAGS